MRRAGRRDPRRVTRVLARADCRGPPASRLEQDRPQLPGHLRCGVPQVATDVGGTSEALIDTETGLLCPPGDPAALAERLVRILGDEPGRTAMGAAGRERHDELFTVERMVELTASVYGRVLASRPSRSSSS